MADTTLVVLAPGMGDAVQAMKAGILECADVFALNKSDLAGADSTLRDLEQMLSLNSEDPWRPIVVSCTATRGQGISELVSALTLHHVWQRTTPAGQEAQRARSRRMLLSYLTDEVLRVVAEERTEELEALVTRVQAGALDPYSACDELLAGLRSQA